MSSNNLGHSDTVLIVEDDPNARRLIELMLSSENISVLMAADAEEALTVYRNRQAEITVILLDLTYRRFPV